MTMDNTARFLQDLDKNFPNHSFYYLDLRAKEKKWAIHIDEWQIELRNSFEKKMCIFFTPNWDYELSGGKRRKDNAQNMYCVFVEFDFASPDDKVEVWKDFEIKPSIVNETYKGYHIYWLIEPVKYWDEWDKVQNLLCWYFGWDWQAKDAARLLRLPWRIYWKNWLWETIIHTILYEPDNKYNLRDFLQFNAPYDNVEKIEQSIVKSMDKNARNLVDDINNTCDVVDVLHKLSSRRQVQSDGSIKEWGATTSWYKRWKEQNKLVCFSNHTEERPQGWPYAVAKFILWSNKDTFTFFKEQYNIWVDIKRQETKVVDKWDKRIDIDYDGGLVSLDFNKWLTTIVNFTKEWEVQTDMMSWAIKTLWYYILEDVYYYIIYYKSISWKEWYMTVSQLARSKELEKKLSSVWITFFVSERNKGRLKLIQYICSTTVEYKYIDYAGGTWDGMYICKSWRYFAKKGDNKYYIDVEQIGSEWDDIFTIWDDISAKDFKEQLKVIEESYMKEMSVTAMLWYMMSLFVREIRREFWFFPILNFVWLTQSGKTTIRRMLMKSFGINNPLELQASTTEFVLMSMCKHSLPLNVGEYEHNERMRVDWDTFLKNNYDGTRNARGTNTQKLIMYNNISPIAIDGEIRSMNNAVYTRSFVLMMNPNFKGREIPRSEIININSYLLKNYNRIHNMKEVFYTKMEKFKKELSWVQLSEKDRMIQNYALLSAFAKTFDLDWYDETLLSQMKLQVGNMGSNNIEKTIRYVFSIAILQRMPAYINKESKCVVVETILDPLRYPQKKVEELKSNIQVVNHHFNNSWGNMEDDLRIPIDYLMQSSTLSSTFVKILNYISSTKRIPEWHIASTLKVFWEQNNHKHEPFYEDTSWNLSHKNKDAKDNGDVMF